MARNGLPDREEHVGRDDTRQPRAGHVPDPVAEESFGPEQGQRRGRLTEKILMLNRFVDGTVKGLDGQTALLWVVLFRHERNGYVQMSTKRLAKIMGVHPRTASRHLKLLRQNKLLRRVKAGVRGVRSSGYQLGRRDLAQENRLKKPPAAPAPSQPEPQAGEA